MCVFVILADVRACTRRQPKVVGRLRILMLRSSIFVEKSATTVRNSFLVLALECATCATMLDRKTREHTMRRYRCRLHVSGRLQASFMPWPLARVNSRGFTMLSSMQVAIDQFNAHAPHVRHSNQRRDRSSACCHKIVARVFITHRNLCVVCACSLIIIIVCRLCGRVVCMHWLHASYVFF